MRKSGRSNAMRTVAERVAAVRSRSRRLRRARANRMIAAFACLVALPLVGFVGRFVAEGPVMPSVSDGGLFGAASLLGPSVGGYVLVALVTAVAVALVTMICVKRRGTDGKEHDSNSKDDRKEV